MQTIVEARKLNDFARSVFLQDKAHVPMVIFFKGTTTLCLMDTRKFMQNGESKDILTQVIALAIKKLGASSLAFITEAWMKKIPQSNSKDAIKQISEKGVSSYSDKEEVLMLTAESDDGLAVCIMNPIHRDNANNPTLGEAEEIRDYTGRFNQFFQKAESLSRPSAGPGMN